MCALSFMMMMMMMKEAYLIYCNIPSLNLVASSSLCPPLSYVPVFCCCTPDADRLFQKPIHSHHGQTNKLSWHSIYRQQLYRER